VRSKGIGKGTVVIVSLPLATHSGRLSGRPTVKTGGQHASRR
jgi:hypothetical protein